MRRWWLVVVVLVTACGWLERDRPGRRVRRPFDQPGVPLTAPGQLPEGSPKLPRALVDGPTRAELAPGQPGLVVLAVLDTVRADHLSACGYARPTSPTLERLAEAGRITCRAYAPSTWTLPSHASLFTGVDPEDHGLLGRGIRLPDRFETLAERFGERGYQTVLLSANPILQEPTGLHQGFQRAQVAQGIESALHGRGLVEALRLELAQLDPSRPLFLFVNVYDAHDPYPQIPRRARWVPHQPIVRFRGRGGAVDPGYAAFRAGSLAPTERAAWIQRITDGYDWGIAVADFSLGQIGKVLAEQGWTSHGHRLVVTSDHGENLGEHDRLLHDGPPFEAVARIPVLWTEAGVDLPPLPEPLSLTDLFHVVSDGALPEAPRRPRSASVHYGPKADPWFEDSVAIWPAADRKWMHRGGAPFAIDLAEDPGEVQPEPVSAEGEAALEAAMKRLEASKTVARASVRDPALDALLDAIGYTDGGH